MHRASITLLAVAVSVIKVQQERKDDIRAKRVSRILETLRQGTVIVEGRHDTRVMRLFGINAITYSQLYAHALPSAAKRVYILTDNDRGGEEKKEKIRAILLEADKGYVIDESLGKRMLRALNSTSVEQVYGPVEEILEGGGKKRRKG